MESFMKICNPTHFLVTLTFLYSAAQCIEPTSAGADTAGTEWQAGVARVDITPEEPLWLGGYAARTKPAEGTLHPLWAKALALKDSAGNQAVLVTTDILGYPKEVAERIRARIEQEHNLPRANLILSASHTHSAPVIGASLKCIYAFDASGEQKLTDYTEQFEDKVTALVGEALAKMAPASLESGNGTARFAVNRRSNKEGALTATSPLQGPNDHAVPVLKVVRSDGAVTAIVFGYACHATVLDGYQWSGDYPGFAQAALETQYPTATALFFAGCGADQNPLPRRSVALARQYGVTLAAAVACVLEGTMTPLPPTLITGYKEVDLALESVPDEAALRQRAESTSGYEQRCTEDLLARVTREGSLPASYPYPVQTWQMGGQTLVVLGGEVVVDYALAIKERLGQNAFIMAYANDLMAYIPSERVREEGGYEGQGAQIIYGLPSPWADGLQERILSEIWNQAAIK